METLQKLARSLRTARASDLPKGENGFELTSQVWFKKSNRK